MLTITDSAVLELKNLLAGKDEAASGGLRIGVGKGGCAGLQYEMGLDAAKAGDTTVEKDGIRVLVDAESVDFLRGSTIDYCDDLAGTGFRIINPNAARSCGCGTSFEPAEEAAAR